MSNFYKQMWNDEKLGKLEAFRNSQRLLLREGKKRGFLVDKPETTKEPARTPPVHWAAFSLSGDWR